MIWATYKKANEWSCKCPLYVSVSVIFPSAEMLRCVARSREVREVAKSLREVTMRCNMQSDFATSRSDFGLRIPTSRYASQLRATHRNFALRIATSRYASQLRASQLRNFALHIISAATVVLLGHHTLQCTHITHNSESLTSKMANKRHHYAYT